MLETSEERVNLLKMGIDGKTIEKMYIKHNDFKIIDRPLFLESIGDNRSSPNIDGQLSYMFQDIKNPGNIKPKGRDALCNSA